jgi:hypothetical protein
LIACDEDSLGLDITLWYPITCANKPCPHQRLSAPLRLKIRLSLVIHRHEPYWKKGLTSQTNPYCSKSMVQTSKIQVSDQDWRHSKTAQKGVFYYSSLMEF